MRTINNSRHIHRQRGVSTIEFAFISILLFVLLFAIIEFGRMFYVFNTVQEVTRRAAREAVVRWTDNTSQNDARTMALFESANMPAYADISAATITIEYLTANGDTLTKTPTNPADNISACVNPTGKVDCIAFVRVSIPGVAYIPLFGFFSGIQLPMMPFTDTPLLTVNLTIPIPESTVTMPAESMGY